MIKPYICAHSRTAIEREIDNAELLVEKEGTGYPDSTYEDGVQDTLRWVLNQAPPPTADAIEHIDK